MAFHESSIHCQIAFVLLIGTTLLLVVSYGAPYWTTRSRSIDYDKFGNVVILRTGGNAGLWSGCTEGECYERYNIWTPNYVKVCGAFMTTSFVLLVLSTVLLFLYMWHRDFDRDKRLVAVSLVNTSLSAFLILLTCVVWPAGQNFQSGEYLNWPYILAVICGIFTVIIAIKILQELRRELFAPHIKLAMDNIAMEKDNISVASFSMVV